jgi:hypothetical protein
MLPNETEAVETHVDASSGRRLQILKRADGLFTFCEEEYGTFQHLSLDTTYSYWYPVAGGGLFGTIEDAKREAFASTPWLKHQDGEEAQI